ncbi:MAG TPA: hypothetical protein VI231_02610 [Candidatus Binatia bacterium]|jgi:hypothetical protein
MGEESPGEKLTQAEFVKKAIVTLRKEPYKGIHTIYSGFNDAFRAYFNDDPIKWTTQLASEGVIVIRPARGGVMIYLAEDAPAGRATAKDTLKKMGL